MSGQPLQRRDLHLPVDLHSVCGDYVCADASLCAQSCTQVTNEGCAADAYCDLNDECQPRKAAGDQCDSAGECEKGLFCTDGVCCGVDACGFCEMCQPGTGTCDFAAAGDDPHDDCAADATLCQLDNCDGKGGCEAEVQGTSCGTNTCANSNCSGQCADTTYTVYECDGVTWDSCPSTANACPDSLTCTFSGTACYQDCVGDIHCLTGSYCEGNTCQDKRANGDPCSDDRQCLSHACHSGFCRECDAVTDCSATLSVCTASGQCNGCTLPTDCTTARWGSACNSGSNTCLCTTDSQCNARAGNCNLNMCQCGTSNAACPIGQLCSTRDDSGVCKFGPGEPCTDHLECLSMVCTLGVCTKLPFGAPCDTSTQCQSNFCNAASYTCG